MLVRMTKASSSTSPCKKRSLSLIFLMVDGFAVAVRTTIFTVDPNAIGVRSKKQSKISTVSRSIYFVKRRKVRLIRNRIPQRSRISQLKMVRRLFRTKTRKTYLKLEKN